MFEIAGGVVIGGVILFLLYIFHKQIVWAALGCFGLWVTVEVLIGFYRAIFKARGHDIGIDLMPDGLFGLAILALIFEVITGAENIRDISKLILGSAIFDRFKKKKIENIKNTLQYEPSTPIVIIAKSRRERAQEILDRYYGTNL